MNKLLKRFLLHFIYVSLSLSMLLGCSTENNDEAAEKNDIGSISSPQESSQPLPEASPVPLTAFGSVILGESLDLYAVDAHISDLLWPTYPGTVSSYLKPEEGHAFLSLDVDIYLDGNEQGDLSGKFKGGEFIINGKSYSPTLTIENQSMQSFSSQSSLSILPGKNRVHILTAFPEELLPLESAEITVTFEDLPMRFDLLAQMQKKDPIAIEARVEADEGVFVSLLDIAYTDKVMPDNPSNEALVINTYEAAEGKSLLHIRASVENESNAEISALHQVSAAFISPDGREELIPIVADAGNGQSFMQNDSKIQHMQSTTLHIIANVDEAKAFEHSSVLLRIGKNRYLLDVPAKTNEAAESPENIENQITENQEDESDE